MINNGTLPGSRYDRDTVFLRLFERVERPLSAYVKQRIGGNGSAPDFVQITMIKAWKYSQFDPTRPEAEAFLFRIVENLIRDWYRSEDSRTDSLDRLSERGSLGPPAIDRRARDPLGALIIKERAEIVKSALTVLAPENREVLERFYLHEEGTQAQIAAAMRLSVPAFNSRLNRARVELKRVIRLLLDESDLDLTELDLSP